LDLNALREKGNVIQVKLSEVFIPLYTYASVKKSENVEFVSQRNSDLREKENLIEFIRFKMPEKKYWLPLFFFQFVWGLWLTYF
jgi:hypothetical protein